MVDFLEFIMAEGYLGQWVNSKLNVFSVKHMGEVFEHDRKLSSIEEIGAKNPLIIELYDNSKN